MNKLLNYLLLFFTFWLFVAWLITSAVLIINCKFFHKFMSSRIARRREAEFFEKMSEMDIEINELLDAADEIQRRRSMAAHPTAYRRKKKMPSLDLSSLARDLTKEANKKTYIKIKPIKDFYFDYYYTGNDTDQGNGTSWDNS